MGFGVYPSYEGGADEVVEGDGGNQRRVGCCSGLEVGICMEGDVHFDMDGFNCRKIPDTHRPY